MKSHPAVRGYRRLIPSVTALVQFEAVARLRSFTQAAHELGVTQAAVSRQVKALEETLGHALFRRLFRAIELTAEGEALYVVVAESMQKIAGVFDQLSSGPVQREFVLTATSAFAHFRLLPRLAALRRRAPALRLRLSTHMFTSDLRHHEIDVAVRYGDGVWPDGTATFLFDEAVFPVCSPAWLAAEGEPLTLDDLARASLIESDSTAEGWMTWDAWFRAVGVRNVRPAFSLRCTLYTDAVSAARGGQGIALGWGRLVDDLLASGELVRLPVASLATAESYYAVVPHGRTITPEIDALIAWLRGDTAPD
ncbi:LysR substrate-binding domain-containing protein [Paraburkholderia aromaticivorans]|uniref:LysR substrate-binding domain-containing protein n=1 Tax=Paraburkholderia aromaticivorans TaxID=2026199 RepID=UPI0038BC5289